MLQGCNGLSLMIGFTNPWAILVRKQCEAGPVAMQGVYELVMSIAIDVPFAKCACVDAARAGSGFHKYMMDNCYYFAPTHLKPMVLALVERSVNNIAGIDAVCTAMVEYAGKEVSDSMQPWFTVQFQGAEQIASSVDYLLKIVDDDSGRCVCVHGLD